MKYLCLAYYDNRIDALSKEEVQALVSQCRAHDESLHKSGHLLAVGSLGSARTSRTVRPRNGKPTVTDGPFAEAKEVIGAFFIIEALGIDEAIEVASKHPAAHLGEHVGWGIEVRPIEWFQEGKSS